MRLVVGLVAVIVTFLAGFQPAFATVEPTATTLDIETGQTVEQIVEVTNDTARPQVYIIDKAGIVFGDSADDLRFIELAPEYAELITIDGTSFTLDSGERREVRVTVSSRDAALAGEFAFAVIARTASGSTEGVGVVSAYASVFFVRLGEGLQPQLRLDAFETVPGTDHSLPIRFATLVTNTGEGLSQPEMGIILRNLWGKEIARLSLNDLGRRLPAGTSRVFTGEWSGHPWRLGPYTAEFYAYADDSDEVLTATVPVVLFPWQMLVVCVVVAAVLSGGIYVLRRAWRREV
jgi:hypothetical protein